MLKQIVMRTAFHNDTILNDHDFVCLFNGRQAVGNHQRGTVFLQLIQCRLNRTFGFGIQRRGSFVQNQNRAITQQGSSDSNTLTLTAREQHAVFTNHCIETVIHLIDEVYGVGHTRRFFNLLTAVLFSPCVSNVVSNRIVKQMDILRHQSNLVT
ncbi:Uncharacterised protein [Shigella sonnei]|nr:Uncharacterised protein [Shigella sonnei]